MGAPSPIVRMSALIAALFALFGMEAGCRHAGAAPTVPSSGNTTTPPRATLTAARTHSSRDLPKFDGDTAMELLKKQCDFGVRPLGSAAHEKLRALLVDEMKNLADKSFTQDFMYRDMKVSNVIGIFYPDGQSQPDAHPVLLLAHWDTRPIADGPFSSEIRRGVSFKYGSSGWNHLAPIMGADDGASGVACLLELARIFHAHRPPVGVIILFDDGEDYGDFEANNMAGDGVELGSRYFAKHYRENPIFGQPSFGILLDMVGAKNMIIPREQVSQQYAPSVNDTFFAVARSLGYGDIFRSDESQAVGDDHVAINEAGIPTIDLIHPLPYGVYEQTGYRYWHTLLDTPDKCSAKSLQAVGDSVEDMIYRQIPSQ